MKNSKITAEMHRAKSRGSPLEIYLGMMAQVYTRKKDLIDEHFHFGISISYKRVMKLSTAIGNDILSQYNLENIVCPPNLRFQLL